MSTNELRDDQKTQITETLLHWASVHPHPNRLISDDEYQIVDGYSPSQIAEELEKTDSNTCRNIYLLFTLRMRGQPEPFDEIDPPRALDELLVVYRNEAASFQKNANKPAVQGKPVGKSQRRNPLTL